MAGPVETATASGCATEVGADFTYGATVLKAAAASPPAAFANLSHPVLAPCDRPSQMQAAVPVRDLTLTHQPVTAANNIQGIPIDKLNPALPPPIAISRVIPSLDFGARAFFAAANRAVDIADAIAIVDQEIVNTTTRPMNVEVDYHVHPAELALVDYGGTNFDQQPSVSFQYSLDVINHTGTSTIFFESGMLREDPFTGDADLVFNANNSRTVITSGLQPIPIPPFTLLSGDASGYFIPAFDDTDFPDALAPGDTVTIEADLHVRVETKGPHIGSGGEVCFGDPLNLTGSAPSPSPSPPPR